MPRLIIKGGGQERSFELVDPITIAGRSSENKIHIDDKQCSRQHCHFERTDHGIKLVDLESRNGTRVNDRVVNQALLRPGDRVDIGKHTLVFEDPNFKEPPAEIAARFAPSAVPPAPPAPAAVPAPAAAAPSPVAAPDAAAAAPSQAPTVSESPRIRRRTGHTTSMSIVRTQRNEMVKEQGLLIKVGIAAGIFLFVLGILIIVPTGGGDAKLTRDRNQLATAKSHMEQGKLNEARAALRSITHPQVAEQANALMRQLDADQKRLGLSSDKEEEAAFSTLYDFCEANRGNPVNAGEVATRCEAFKKAFSNSPNLERVNSYLEKAREMVSTEKKGAVADGEKQAREDAGRKEFATAVKRLNDLLDKVTDIDARTRIVALHDEIVDKAKKYFFAERAKAEDHISRGRPEDAKTIYQALIDSMGNGAVDEFSDYCKIAQLKLKTLQ